MKETESLEEFYKRKFDTIPENYRKEIGHFFQQFGQFQQYELFQPRGNHIFELSDEQADMIRDQSRMLCVRVAE